MEIKSWNPVISSTLIKKVSLVLGVAAFGLVNLCLPINSFERARLAVLSRPEDPAAHLELSNVAVQAIDWNLARAEFDRASSLIAGQKSSRVFGITSQYEEVQSRAYMDLMLSKKIKTLQKILENYPNYRDIYLLLSVFYYQLSDKDASHSYWNMARELDPNHPEVIKIGTFLQNNG